jgi:hypothetical protein
VVAVSFNEAKYTTFFSIDPQPNLLLVPPKVMRDFVP